MAVWSLSGLTACTTSSCWNRVIRFSITEGNSFSHSLLREKLDHSEPSSKFNTWYSLGKLVCNHWKIMPHLRNFRIKILRDIESKISYWHWREYSLISCMSYLEVGHSCLSLLIYPWWHSSTSVRLHFWHQSTSKPLPLLSIKQYLKHTYFVQNFFGHNYQLLETFDLHFPQRVLVSFHAPCEGRTLGGRLWTESGRRIHTPGSVVSVSGL